jgi:hypothetical protein
MRATGYGRLVSSVIFACCRTSVEGGGEGELATSSRLAFEPRPQRVHGAIDLVDVAYVEAGSKVGT